MGATEELSRPERGNADFAEQGAVAGEGDKNAVEKTRSSNRKRKAPPLPDGMVTLGELKSKKLSEVGTPKAANEAGSKQDKQTDSKQEKQECKQEKKTESKGEKQAETKQEKQKKSKQEKKKESAQEKKKESTQEKKKESMQEKKKESTQEKKKESKREKQAESKQEKQKKSKQEKKKESAQEKKKESTQEKKKESTQEKKKESMQEKKKESTQEKKKESMQEKKKESTQEKKKESKREKQAESKQEKLKDNKKENQKGSNQEKQKDRQQERQVESKGEKQKENKQKDSKQERQKGSKQGVPVPAIQATGDAGQLLAQLQQRVATVQRQQSILQEAITRAESREVVSARLEAEFNAAIDELGKLETMPSALLPVEAVEWTQQQWNRILSAMALERSASYSPPESDEFNISSPSAEPSNRAQRLWNGFQMSDKVVVSVGRGRAIVRIDTGDTTNAYDSPTKLTKSECNFFYLELAWSMRCRRLTLLAQSAPFFLNVDMIACTNLISDPPALLENVSDVLQAYAARKSQVAELNVKFGHHISKLHCNLAHTQLDVFLNVHSRAFLLRVLYENHALLPSHVWVHCWDKSSDPFQAIPPNKMETAEQESCRSQRIRSLEKFYRQKVLPAAFAEMLFDLGLQNCVACPQESVGINEDNSNGSYHRSGQPMSPYSLRSSKRATLQPTDSKGDEGL